MRHNKKFNHLGRKSGHRKAMLANMASSLILHKRIETTVAKAKALRVYVEPLITKSKEDTTHSRRVVFSHLKQKEAVTELFRVVAPKVADRPGGYTRVLKIGFRQGDGADMAIIELVDFNEAALASTIAKEEVKRPATRRSRSRRGTKTTEKSVKSEEIVEQPVAEEKPVVKEEPAPVVEEKPAAKEEPAPVTEEKPAAKEEPAPVAKEKLATKEQASEESPVVEEKSKKEKSSEEPKEEK